MKKAICIGLIIGIITCVCGCSPNVNLLVEEGNYDEALAIMEKNPDKYIELYDEVRYKVAQRAFNDNDFEKVVFLLQDNNYEQATTLLNDTNYKLAEIALNAGEYENVISLLSDSNSKEASELLSYTYELKTATEIEKFYNEMLNEIEEYNPDKWNPNFDYMDGADFYLKISDMLNETYDIIIRDNKLDNAKEKFVDIFGYEPDTVSQAKDDIEELSNAMEFEKYYDSPFFYYNALEYVMYDLTKNSEFVRFEMTNTSGFMIIEQPLQFLKENGISPKTFAYLLGTCENMGGIIERDSEKIIITFENPQSDTYYSRGYYYCAPNSQRTELSDFFSNLSFSIDNWGLDEIGVWMETTITNPEKHNIKYMSVDAILENIDGEHIATASVLLENVDDEKISFTLDFYDVTMDMLKETECEVFFFPKVVINK